MSSIKNFVFRKKKPQIVERDWKAIDWKRDEVRSEIEK